MNANISHESQTDKRDDACEKDCFACVHFWITHDRDFPYGCRAAGFKSKAVPSKEMYTHSGMVCQLFQEKRKRS